VCGDLSAFFIAVGRRRLGVLVVVPSERGNDPAAKAHRAAVLLLGHQLDWAGRKFSNAAPRALQTGSGDGDGDGDDNNNNNNKAHDDGRPAEANKGQADDLICI
jgi:hypothetical protein